MMSSNVFLSTSQSKMVFRVIQCIIYSKSFTFERLDTDAGLTCQIVLKFILFVCLFQNQKKRKEKDVGLTCQIVLNFF